MNYSLRRRLLIGMVGSMTVLLVLFSLILYTIIRRQQIHQFNQSLLSTARILAASVEIDEDGTDVEYYIEQIQDFINPRQPIYYQIWQQDQVITKSPLLGTRTLARFHGDSNEPVFKVIQPSPGRWEHAISVRLPGRRDFEYQDKDEQEEQESKYQGEQIQTNDSLLLDLVVTKDATVMYHQLSMLAWTLTCTLGAILMLAIVTGITAVKQGLRPLEALAAEIGAITEKDLVTRVGQGNVPREMLPITSQLNALLQRLEQAFNRERRFSADVAHELRTPLAGLRTTLEVALSRQRDEQAYRSSLAECTDIVMSLHALVEKLLTLARLDTSQIDFQVEPIALRKMITAAWEPFIQQAQARHLCFENHVTDTLQVYSDTEYLTMVFANLLSNAATYTDEGGQIRVTSSQLDHQIRITLSNTGCTLTPDQISHIFEDFWRADTARTHTGRHSGLGLALVKRIITALHGCIEAEVDDTGLFSVHLVLQDLPGG